jgi:hypothetical protein
MNLTVKEFSNFLLNAGLNHLENEFMEYVEDLERAIDSKINSMLSKMKTFKLRIENLRGNVLCFNFFYVITEYST